MTLRQLVQMAEARREFEGDLLAWLVRCVPVAVWAPRDLPRNLNPFKQVSEAMLAHLERWKERRWRVATGSTPS